MGRVVATLIVSNWNLHRLTFFLEWRVESTCLGRWVTVSVLEAHALHFRSFITGGDAETTLMQAHAPVCVCLLRWVCAGTLPSWCLMGGGRHRPVTEVDTHGRLYGLKLGVAVDTSERTERARSSATMRLRLCSVYRVATATTLLPEPRGNTVEPLTPFSGRSLPITTKLGFSFFCITLALRLRSNFATVSRQTMINAYAVQIKVKWR